MAPMTLDDLRTRATISVPEAGQLLGIERKSAYNAARRGELPTITLGRRLLVPTQALLDMLSVGSKARQHDGST